MSESERIPAVIYAAKSTEDTHGSIPTQIEECRAMAEREGWTIVGEFQDEAFSGFKGNRGPDLEQAKQAAIAAAREDGRCVLVAQDADRFARGAGDAPGAADHVGEVYFALKRQGVELWTVRSRKLDLLRATLEGERATGESARKSQAVKAGVKRRVVDRRQFVGGRRPFGYRWGYTLREDGQRVGRLVIDQAEAAIVRRIFAETLAGNSQRGVAIGLNADAVPTLTDSGQWYATTVAGMLRNPLFKGWVTHQGESYPAIGADGQPTHEAIIDDETWERVRELRDARAATGRPRGRRSGGSHLLTEGLLLCPTCNGPMSPVTKRDKRAASGIYETYVCVKRLHHGVDACSQKRIKRAGLDVAIFDMFKRRVLDHEATRQLLVDQVKRLLDGESDLRRSAESEAAKAEAAVARVERDYLDGKLSVEKWERLEAKLNAELEGARAQVEQHESKRAAVEAVVAEFDAQAAIAAELTVLRQRVVGEVRESDGDLDRLRALLRRLFDSFELAASVDGYLLLPLPRVPRTADGRWDFEGAGRGAFDFSDNFHARLAAW